MSALDLSPEEFQSLAARVTDMATRFLAALPTLPSYPNVSGQQTRERFGEPLPETGLHGAALDMLEDVVAMSRPPSPRFYGYVLGSGEPVAALADLLASATTARKRFAGLSAATCNMPAIWPASSETPRISSCWHLSSSAPSASDIGGGASWRVT